MKHCCYPPICGISNWCPVYESRTGYTNDRGAATSATAPQTRRWQSPVYVPVPGVVATGRSVGLCNNIPRTTHHVPRTSYHVPRTTYLVPRTSYLRQGVGR